MTFLLDMNMSTRCVGLLADRGFNAIHWSTVGDPKDEDEVLVEYALTHNLVIITFDLDFGAILSATSSFAPSVVLIRPAFAHPEDFMPQLTSALASARVALFSGALVLVELDRIRIRPLPI